MVGIDYVYHNNNSLTQFRSSGACLRHIMSKLSHGRQLVHREEFNLLVSLSYQMSEQMLALLVFLEIPKSIKHGYHSK